MKAILILEDGKSFLGDTVADVSGEAVGQAILNTAVVGYQEALTDPANAGKAIVFTYPLIGNYGIAPKFNESSKPWVACAVIKEKSAIYSNWQAKGSIDEFVLQNNILVVSGVDTRSLAVHIRNKGELTIAVSTKNFDKKVLLGAIAQWRKEKKKSFLADVSVKEAFILGKKNASPKIAVLDLGVARSTLKQLESLGAGICVLPYSSKSRDILRHKPAGLVISGGPEDDEGLEAVAGNVKELIGKLPMLGLSSGCLVLAMALGGRTVKMKLGHRGVNYPLRSPASYKGEITVQNHCCAIDPGSLKKIKDLKITGYNLNDHSVEEIESRKLKLIGAQYYPASPGLGEVNPVFHRFMKYLPRSK